MKNLLVIIATTLLLTSCNLLDAVKGDKNIVKKEYAVSDFSAINIAIASSIVYQQMDTDSVHLRIEIDSNLIEYLDLEVKNGQLNIRTFEDQIIEPSKFVIYTNVETINRINLSGVGDFTIPNKFSTSNLSVSVTGVGDLQFDNLEVDTLNVRVTGTGDIKLTGKATYTDFAVTGVGNIDSYGFASKTAKCAVSGVGDIKVNVTDSLESSVSGVGSVKYKGTPHVVNNVSGIGSVKNTKK